MRNVAWEMLQERGVDLDGLAKLVLELQLPYDPTLTLEEAHLSLRMVLAKREVQHAVITGVNVGHDGRRGEPQGAPRGDHQGEPPPLCYRRGTKLFPSSISTARSAYQTSAISARSALKSWRRSTGATR